MSDTKFHSFMEITREAEDAYESRVNNLAVIDELEVELNHEKEITYRSDDLDVVILYDAYAGVCREAGS